MHDAVGIVHNDPIRSRVDKCVWSLVIGEVIPKLRSVNVKSRMGFKDVLLLNHIRVIRLLYLGLCEQHMFLH